MKSLYKNIPIPATDGKELVAGNKLFAFAWTHSDFVNYGLSHEEDKSVATKFEVFEITKNSTYKEMFTTPEKQWVTQAQMLAFIKENRDKLRQGGYATFFLLKKDNEFFVAYVCVSSDGLYVFVGRFENVSVWNAGLRHRLVCPQVEEEEERQSSVACAVAFEKGNIPAYRLTTDNEQKEAEAIEYIESRGYEVKKWEPTLGKMFWYFNSKGEKIHQRWEGTPKQIKLLAFGNCFPSEKICEAKLLAAKEAIK